MVGNNSLGIGTFISSFGVRALSNIASFLVVPLLLVFLGKEGFGLLGWHASATTMVQVLDFGFAVAIVRELARRVNQPDNNPRLLLGTGQRLFDALGLLLGGGFLLLTPLLVEWMIQAPGLPSGEIWRSFIAMGVLIGLQFPSMYAHNALTGMGHLGLANGIIIVLTLLRVGGSVTVAWMSQSVDLFFVWHATITLLQVLLLRWLSWRLCPGHGSQRWSKEDFNTLWRFAAPMGMGAIANTLVTQGDRLLLGRWHDLEKLGVYNVGVSLAAGLQSLILPLYPIFLPTLSARLHADNVFTDSQEKLRRHLLQLTSLCYLPAGALLLIECEEVITVWTGNVELATQASPSARGLLLASMGLGSGLVMKTLAHAAGRPDFYAKVAISLSIPTLPSLVWAAQLPQGPLWIAWILAVYSWSLHSGITFLTSRLVSQSSLLRDILMNLLLPLALCWLVIFGLGSLVPASDDSPRLFGLLRLGFLWFIATLSVLALYPDMQGLIAGRLARLLGPRTS